MLAVKKEEKKKKIRWKKSRFRIRILLKTLASYQNSLSKRSMDSVV
jgi:hypothetical protein